MPSVEQCDDGASLTDASLDAGPLGQLIRSAVALTQSCSKGGRIAPVNGVSEQVVFDVDVDGSRYILIKTVPVKRTAHSLSPREREIVRMVALGHQNKVIAAVLNISAWTVCTHLRRIFTKLGVSSRAAMVAKVTDLGSVVEPKAAGIWGAGRARPEALTAHFAERKSECGEV